MYQSYFLKRATPLIISMLILFFGCSPSEDTRVMNEGVIVYEVSFPFDQDNLYINIYPREMTFTFKDNKVRAKLASFAEVVCSEFIMDNSNKSFTQYFKVFDEKYKMELDDAGVQKILAELPTFNLQESNELDSLAGILCQKTFAHFIDRSIQPITLYHTGDIPIDAPNWYNQFSEINEVLLGYEVEQFGKRMELTAKQIRYEPVPDERFNAPNGYADLSFDEMHLKISNLVAEFDQN